ncbi:membrane protein [Streptomyces albireticuli]|uniref:Membrane protein n=1 Tax=Streptomyces albireticuli TaxID=1940 RepID=A0A1Z2L6Q9_9ACTN|nr:membrane protein [Streptomyces albireticuli]
MVMEYSEAKVPRPRPLVTVLTDDGPLLTEGVKVHRVLPDGRAQTAEFVGHVPEGGGALTVRLTGGMGRGKVPDGGSVPEKGDRVCWTLFEHAPRGGPELPEPERTPWTHGGPPDGTADAPDPLTAEDLL